MTRIDGLPPNAHVDTYKPCVEHLNQFWDEVMESGDSGATTWEVVVELYQQYMECLQKDPCDEDRANSITAKAFHLIAGNEHC